MVSSLIEGKLYGLHIKTNIKLPIAFPNTVKQGTFENDYVEILFVNVPPVKLTSYQQYTKDSRSNVLYKRFEENFLVETDRIGAIEVSSNHVYYFPLDNDFESISEKNGFLLSYGIGLSTLLRCKQRVVLHATTLNVNGQTILIMGPSGVGKSTLASYLLCNHNAKMISDDMTCINNGHIELGFNMIRLWPDTLTTIFGKKPQNYVAVGKKGKVYFPLDNQVRNNRYKIDKLVFLKLSYESKIHYKELTTNEMCLNLFKHIYNKDNLFAPHLKAEAAKIISLVNQNCIKAISVETPRTYGALKEIASIVL